MTIRTVLGADPGGTTGLARVDLDGFRPPLLLEGRAGVRVTLGQLDELLGAQDPAEVLLAVEAFVVGPRAGRSSTPAAGRLARELVGALHGWATERGIRVAERSASAVKPWATDKRLRAAGLYQPGRPHARDAARHALFAAVKDCGHPDPLSRRGRAVVSNADIDPDGESAAHSSARPSTVNYPKGAPHA